MSSKTSMDALALLAPSENSHRPPKKPRKDSDGIPFPEISDLDYVNLTSHSDQFGVDPVPISWGHPDPAVRGPRHLYGSPFSSTQCHRRAFGILLHLHWTRRRCGKVGPRLRPESQIDIPRL